MRDSTTYATYALISPSGELEFRPDGPKQMRRDVAVGLEAPHEFTVFSASAAGLGLHGCVSSISHPVAPPNHVGAAVIAELGGPPHEEWLGPLGLCGIRADGTSGEIELCGLTDAQRRLITEAHAAAIARLAGIEP
jgi:hypothetical protein